MPYSKLGKNLKKFTRKRLFIVGALLLVLGYFLIIAALIATYLTRKKIAEDLMEHGFKDIF